MENKDQITFGLRQITTEQFAVIESAFDEAKSNFELGTGLRFGFNTDKRIITPLLAINFSQDKSPFLLLEIGCHFEIIEEHWKNLFNSDTKELKLPKELARHLVMLTVGTLRGVLHAKTENTPFNKFFIPTINVNDLVKEDLLIKTNDSIEKK
ncbi:hypothetical protein [Flavobacterium sp. 83]|jgi:hypothetical protein|uniref:hypothetical protein n=1 Tax=Flavobacterium sp. 83 TaxID=1131812 RepID=UPI0005519680|nr:hypothetical protein [Flavobacterium sp. 83]